MFCSDHALFYNEIDQCYKCVAKQESCAHNNQGPDKLFNSTEYANLTGHWNVCYDCGKLLIIE